MTPPKDSNITAATLAAFLRAQADDVEKLTGPFAELLKSSGELVMSYSVGEKDDGDANPPTMALVLLFDRDPNVNLDKLRWLDRIGDVSQFRLDVDAECERQAEKWGGDEHDDEHSTLDWLRFFRKRVRLIAQATQVHSYRKAVVELTALGISAGESWDRIGRAVGGA